MTTILIVEDEPNVAASLVALLECERYVVHVAASIADARRCLGDPSSSIDGILLDWRLPDGEGIDFLKEVRQTSSVPILLVTARVDVIDRVLGLELGADDYLTKPVEPRELLARLKVRLRPHVRDRTPARAATLEHAGVVVDLDTREVRFDGTAVPTTRMEFGLLVLLLEHPGRVFSREEILNRVWGYERTPTTRTVDTHVAELRSKLRPELIESVRGIGYRMVQKLTKGGA